MGEIIGPGYQVDAKFHIVYANNSFVFVFKEVNDLRFYFFIPDNAKSCRFKICIEGEIEKQVFLTINASKQGMEITGKRRFGVF